MTSAHRFGCRDSRRPTGVAFVLPGIFLVACGQAERDRRVDEWMSCVECIDNQRARVADLGNNAVYQLATNLLSPPPRRLEAEKLRIIESYRPVTALTEQEYLAAMLEAFVARAQIRAAVSLGDIKTSRARAELERALRQAETRNYRSDVVRAINVALVRVTSAQFSGSMNATFTGTPVSAGMDFGDTVRVHAGSTEWDGDESVELIGSPFGKEILLNRFNTPGTDDSLEFVAVGEVGSYALKVTGIGPSNLSEVDTTTRIRSLQYAAHDLASPAIVTQADLPQTRYIVLGAAAGADTIDFFKVQSNVDLTATVRWPGIRNVHLAWRDCFGSPPGSDQLGNVGPMSVAGRIVDAFGTGVSSAQVNVVGTNVGAFSTAIGSFSLATIPPGAAPGGLVTLRVRRIGYAERQFKVGLASIGNVLTLSRPDATAATAMNSVSSSVSMAAAGCAVLQVWTPPGRHQILQLRLAQ